MELTSRALDTMLHYCCFHNVTVSAMFKAEI